METTMTAEETHYLLNEEGTLTKEKDSATEKNFPETGAVEGLVNQNKLEAFLHEFAH